MSRSIGLGLVAVMVWGMLSSASAQVELCREAERFMVDDIGMVAVAEPDTIDDWRTKAMVPGCRVTAAGATRRAPGAEATRFYERVREAGWIRTPEPRDAPNEASLRFRRDEVDCLFSFYTSTSALNTDAEWEVNDAVVPGPGERRFNFLVMCTPAAPAAPRGDALGG